MGIPYDDRRDAGRQLAGRLMAYAGDQRALVLGLPRGGVPVAAEVARELGAPLDVLLVRKLGVPSHPELAMGAIAENGPPVVNDDVVEGYGLRADDLERVGARERQEIARQAALYRSGRQPVAVEGRIAIVVDDGLATGASMEAAVRALAGRQPARIVVGVPVAAVESVERLRGIAHEVVAAATPRPFHAVGAWYEDFAPTEDAEVIALLDGAAPHEPR
jgi:putative phosphoribosyl transferase